MATKKQKREAAEARRAEFMARVKADGLAALERSQHARAVRRSSDDEPGVVPLLDSGSKHRGSAILQKVKAGINPSTGKVFTDEEMAEMESKANTPERKHMYRQIVAGRAGTLNEQPPVGGMDDYLVPLEEMTVGQFRKLSDLHWEHMQKQLKNEISSKGYVSQATEEVYEMRRRGGN